MLCIARQTSGPIGLTFFVNTHGRPRDVKGKKKFNIFFSTFFSFKFLFYGQHRALLVMNK